MPRAINPTRLWSNFQSDYQEIFGEKLEVDYWTYRKNEELFTNSKCEPSLDFWTEHSPGDVFQNLTADEFCKIDKFWTFWKKGWDNGAGEGGSSFLYPD